MTLGQFFNYISANPIWVIIYFSAIPAVAFLIGASTKQNGQNSPWSYMYSGLIYLVAVPGIFAITLTVYLFFFERRSIFDTNIITQVLPILSMFITFFIIKKYVNLNYIPGFAKLGNAVAILSAVILGLWILEKTRIFVISFVPFQYFLIILIGLIVVIRYSWSRMSK